MRKSLLIGLSTLLLACGQEDAKIALPQPKEITGESVGHYCSMNLDEHIGPKAQIFVKSRPDNPYWFSTVKQMLVFRELPEEPKDIAAIYVTDMAQVSNWEEPNAHTAWIDASKAFYVIKSRFIGGMGMEDAIPFSSRESAQVFIDANGGEIKTLDEMEEDYIFEGSSLENTQ